MQKLFVNQLENRTLQGRKGVWVKEWNVGKLVAAHGYRQKRENKLEIKK
jgi:hypothetical protein